MSIRLFGLRSRARLRILQPIRVFHRARKTQKAIHSSDAPTDLEAGAKNEPYSSKIPCKAAFNPVNSFDPAQSASITSPPTNTSTLASADPKNVHRKREQQIFTSSSALDVTTAPRVSSTLSEMISGLLQHESASLTRSLDIDTKPGAAVDYSHLEPVLCDKLAAQVDDYNRLVILLNQHPLAVPHQLTVELYSAVTSVPSLYRQIFLRSLVFRQEWDHFWLIAFEETATLSDAEEMVELLYKELQACGAVRMGLWRALHAAFTRLENQQLLQYLCDCIAYRFEVSAAEIDAFHRVVAGEIAFDTVDVFADAGRQAAVVLACLELTEAPPDEFLRRYLLKHPQVFSNRGFVGELLKHVPGVFAFVVSRDNLYLNELDLFYLWQHCTLATLPEALVTKLAMHLSREMRRKIRLSEFLRHYMINEIQSVSLQLATVGKLYESVLHNTLTRLFPILLRDAPGRAVLRRLRKKRPQVFEDAVLALLQAQSVRDSTQNTEKHEQHRKASFQPLRAQDLFWLLDECSYDHRHVFDAVLEHVAPTHANIDELLNLRHVSVSDLTLVWAFALRNRLLSQRLSVFLFQKILGKTWCFNDVAQYARISPRMVVDDFHQRWDRSTAEERARLVARIHHLSRSLSACDVDYIAEILNHLHTALVGRAGVLAAAEKTSTNTSANTFTQTASAPGCAAGSAAEALQKSMEEGLETIQRSFGALRAQGTAAVHLSNKKHCPRNLRANTRQKSRQNPENVDIHTHDSTCAFTLFQSPAGRKFVVDKIVRNTMRYLYQRQGSTAGVQLMGDLLRRLGFESHAGLGVVYEHIVMLRPQSALLILQKHRNRRAFVVREIMNGIEQGILQTRVLSLQQRLRFFEAFQAAKTDLRYSGVPSGRTAIMLGNLAAQQEPRDDKLVARARLMARHRRAPWHLIR